jgi:hypothetical protein
MYKTKQVPVFATLTTEELAEVPPLSESKMQVAVKEGYEARKAVESEASTPNIPAQICFR